MEASLIYLFFQFENPYHNYNWLRRKNELLVAALSLEFERAGDSNEILCLNLNRSTAF